LDLFEELRAILAALDRAADFLNKNFAP